MVTKYGIILYYSMIFYLFTFGQNNVHHKVYFFLDNVGGHKACMAHGVLDQGAHIGLHDGEGGVIHGIELAHDFGIPMALVLAHVGNDGDGGELGWDDGELVWDDGELVWDDGLLGWDNGLLGLGDGAQGWDDGVQG